MPSTAYLHAEPEETHTLLEEAVCMALSWETMSHMDASHIYPRGQTRSEGRPLHGLYQGAKRILRMHAGVPQQLT